MELRQDSSSEQILPLLDGSSTKKSVGFIPEEMEEFFFDVNAPSSSSMIGDG